MKDRYGLMWFATEDGLNKFDGTTFTVYRHKAGDSKSLEVNYISELHEDKSGNLWIGTNGGSLSRYDRKNDNFINFPSSPGSNTINHNVIRGICSDSLGRIWIAHFGGVNIYDPGTGKISKFYQSPGTPFQKQTLSIFNDSRQQMWIGTVDGLYVYNLKSRILKRFLHNANNPSSLSGSEVNAIIEDKQKHLWFGTNGGLSMLQGESSSFINYKHVAADVHSLTDNDITALALNQDNQLWIGTAGGLNILNPLTRTNQPIRFDARKENGLTAKGLNSLYIDDKGICWVGTYRGGINKYDRDLNNFNLVRSNPFDEAGLPASIVTSFAEVNSGEVYVGTDGGGLSVFNLKTHSFRKVELRSKLRNGNGKVAVLALAVTRNNQLLIATYNDGLYILNTNTGAYQQLVKGSRAEDLNSNEIFCIKEDSYGNIWLGTNGDGINVINKANKVAFRYTPNPLAINDIKMPANGFIRDIVEDRKGNFWLATMGGGITYLEKASGRFTTYNTANSKLPNDRTSTILEDSKGNIWVGTLGGGFGSFDTQSKQFTSISETEGLQNNTICKILEDQRGILWISTGKGLSTYIPSTKEIHNYTYHNGLQQSGFVRGAGLKASDQYLFFGGLEGFNYFSSKNIRKDNLAPVVLITDLKISNRSVIPSEDGPIKENISIAKQVDLDYKQNFALTFVGLNYSTPEQNTYAYKLEGFDKDWNYVGSSNTAHYTNLDPGEYVFYIKAGTNNRSWSTQPTTIKISVHPPLWRTGYAYAFYVLAAVSLLLFVRHKGIQKIQRKYRLEQQHYESEQQRKEAERIRELDHLKLKFLTNLSHEFRTPISLILGPVDSLLTNQQGGAASSHLNMIKRNARRLLNLVNQLLDFRKMEEQELKLQRKEGELISFAKDVFESFQDLSERKKIEFVFTSNINSYQTVFDHDKIERILFNLLSNAFKFTMEGGSIRFSIESGKSAPDDAIAWITMRVHDSGIGIPEEKKDKIFERFFQNTTESILNQGSGIGLSITKEFITMHGGTIEVESEVGHGSTFIVQLPFSRLEIPTQTNGFAVAALPEVAGFPAATFPIDEIKEETLVKKGAQKPLVLLVEDNEDFRFYLKENLRLLYKVVEASNGEEGWQKALSLHPKLIISDIDMPGMNGIELCKKIKTDKRTCHIPVILLTAFTAEREQIIGLKTGANDYVTKPFNAEILHAKIKNLLISNDTLKNTYSKQIEFLAPQPNIETSGDKLLHNIVLYIEENLTDTQLSVENLSKHVGMSRSSLYSKLLELTGQTPIEYIRTVKLDKAALLLEHSSLNVTEIAYTVGFTTPNYFAKSFKSKFNMLPSEYISKMRKPDQGAATTG